MKKKYQLVYADPPWKFSASQNRKGAPWSSAAKYYECLPLEKIVSLPVLEIVTKDSMLFIWAPWTHTREVFTVIDAWGFQFKTAGFVWVKTNKDGSVFKGLGLYTRGGAEVCWIGRRGRGLLRKDEGINQVVFARRGRHSVKPKEVRERLEKLYGDVARIELFAREETKGWDSWGKEIGGENPFKI